MVVSTSPPTNESSPLQVLIARRSALLRAAALVYAVGAGAFLMLGTPFVFARLLQPCTTSVCAVGQLSPPGMQVLVRVDIEPTLYATYVLLLALSVPLLGLTLALTVVWRRPDDRMALLFALFFATCPIVYSGVPDVLLQIDPRQGWITQVFELTSLIFWPLFCVFPDGRFVPHWSRWLLVPHMLYAAVLVLQPIALVASDWFSAIQNGWFMGYSIAVVLFQVYRYRRVADSIQRQQIKWVIGGLLGIALGVVVASVVPSQLQSGMPGFALTHTLYTASLILTLLALWHAVLRHHLFTVDLIINRTLVYAALTTSVVLLYALIVGGIGSLLHSQGNLLLSLVAAGTIGVLFQPLHTWLQRGVDRLLYGARAEPYRVLTELSRRLAVSIEPEAVFQTIVDAVRETLKLPYAAIVIPDHAGGEVCVGTEALARPRAAFAIHYQQTQIGQLVVAPRAGEAVLSTADIRLLTELADHAGAAIHAVRLTDDLRRSRAQLVTAREEERRRLRRDLHDGLGPALATITLQADTARDLIRTAPDEAVGILAELTTQAQLTMQDVRRLIYALRPPILDDLGLVAALRALASSLRNGYTDILVDACESLPSLPAAVDVALYRIVQEALTNVVKHANATTCRVSLCCDAAGCMISIIDDGRGIFPEHGLGIGLQSMRERAEELGGRCIITCAIPYGTEVRAWLPLGGNYGTHSPPDR